MSRFNATIQLAVLVALQLSAVVAGECAAASGAQPGSAAARGGTPAQASGVPSPDRDAKGQVQVVVYKSARTLAVYRDGDFDREYRVVLGLQPFGRKRHASDARTPEGLYHVIGKRPHARWQFFLALDYPNDTDRRIYADEVRAGKIPEESGAPFAIGGAIGIHGNDRTDEQQRGVDWTKGCVALSASDIAELEAVVPAGTPVWIVP